MKRTLEITISVVALVVLSPLFAVVALLVWIEDFGSPFFLSRRVGRNGREFLMVKFRTMRPDAWKSKVTSTARDDARITRIGARLRSAKLDEIPQLANVLLGDMGLVGPRPQVASEVELYTLEECALLTVRPGLTDLASIVFSDEADILAGSAHPDLLYRQIIRPWKSRLALVYLRHASIGFDFQILALTLTALVSRRAALTGVLWVLRRYHADELVQRVAARHEPLAAHPPPGAEEIAA